MATILVVDDRLVNRQFLSTLLGYAGHRTLEAGDGAEALAIVRAERPDLVISDVLMPTMDGVELVERLAADPAVAGTPVIFYTATYRLREAGRLADSCGVRYVLPKPSEPEEILRTVNEALGLPASHFPSPGLQAALPVSEPFGRVSEHMSALQALNRGMTAIIDRGLKLADQRQHPPQLPEEVARSVSDLQSVSLRLAALLEMGLDLASQREPIALLEVFCRAVRHITSARYAVLGVQDQEGRSLIYLVTRGMDAETEARLGISSPRTGVLGSLLDTRRPHRVRNPGGNPRALDFPASHPPIHSFLGVPIASAAVVYGWIYVADKLGAEEFSEEDEQLAVTLAAQVALAYENTNLLEDLQKHAVALRLEMTERKRAESKLRDAHEMLKAVVESSLAAIVALQVNGSVITWSRAAETMFEWTETELLGLPLPFVSDGEAGERIRALAEAVLRGESFRSLEMTLRKRNGSPIEVSLSAAPLKDAAGIRGFVMVFEDITQRLNLEQQFRQSQKLEVAGRLAGGVAHDFNNLLTAIGGYVELTLMRLGPEDPLRGNMDEIGKAVGRAASLTGQLLAFSRKQVLEPKVLNLNEAISGTEKMLMRLIREDIQLITSRGEDLGLVRVDPGQLVQIVMNLAVNAHDAMPGGGTIVMETRNIELAPEQAGRLGRLRPGWYVMLSMSDTGCGMDAKTKARIFEPFFTTKGEAEGTGLGLSTVYGIVEQSGGHIDVASEPGRGTTFKIYFPRVEAEIEQNDPVGPREGARGGAEIILLVEDDPGIRRVARVMLEQGGYGVIEAAGGREALEICEKHEGRIHLLMTDVIMPSMNGRELAGLACGIRRDMKVLYMSGYTGEALERYGPLEQGQAFLHKPFSRNPMMRKVREVLDGTEDAAGRSEEMAGASAKKTSRDS